MRLLFLSCSAALLGMALLSSCSRPVAYLQPSPRDYFPSQPQQLGFMKRQETTKPSAECSPFSARQSATSEPVTQAQQAVEKLEAYVRNDIRLASSQKLTRRLTRLHEVMNATNQPSLTLTPVASPKQPTLIERAVFKKMNQKLKQHLAPDQPRATGSNLLLGIIIGVVGLILLLVGSGFLNVLGIIGLVVGVVLIVLSLLNS